MARVLVVEDEPNMRKLISLQLRAEGHSLVAVGMVREGLAALETQDFDVILTDQKLPDGWALRSWMRFRRASPQLRSWFLRPSERSSSP